MKLKLANGLSKYAYTGFTWEYMSYVPFSVKCLFICLHNDMYASTVDRFVCFCFTCLLTRNYTLNTCNKSGHEGLIQKLVSNVVTATVNTVVWSLFLLHLWTAVVEVMDVRFRVLIIRYTNLRLTWSIYNFIVNLFLFLLSSIQYVIRYLEKNK